MADPQSYRPKTSDIPAQPGVYRFIDAEDRVIYVGKAKSLRSRLVNYFQPPEKLHPRTRTMVFTAVRVVWVVVANERAALTLEYQWIKEFSPRFNVIFRDDKSYPYLAVTASEEYPRLLGTRAAHKKGDKYYGPYTKGSIRDSVDLLLKVFPVRSCSKGVFHQAQRSGRPCLNGYIDRCIAPCVGRADAEEHRALVDELIAFLDSDGSALIAQKTAQMYAAAKAQNYEQAARLRDEATALKTLAEKNAVVLDSSVDADIFGLDFDELEASVQVFYVRGGRIRGQRGWVSEIEDVSEHQLLEDVLVHVYGDGAAAAHAHDLSASGIGVTHESESSAAGRARAKTAPRYVDDVEHTETDAIPREIWLPANPHNRPVLEQWLSELRGGAVRIKVPQRGQKAQLMSTVHVNAAQALQRHKLARSGDLTVRSQALEELREGLGLNRAPLRIECFDISHTQGTNQVASMVVFEDGLAKKADYRKFIIRGENGEGATDDTAAMTEVLTRRLSRLAAGARPDDASDDEPLTGGQGGAASAKRAGVRSDALGRDEDGARGQGQSGVLRQERWAGRQADAGDGYSERSGSADAGGGSCDPAHSAAELSATVQAGRSTLTQVDSSPLMQAGSAPLTQAGRSQLMQTGNSSLRQSGALSPDDASNTIRRFAYRPDLIVVDGGLPQVNAAQRVIDSLGADVAVIGLAKRLEEVWLPGEEFPLILPRQSAALHLLQFVRDESHRFAITFHRKKRSKAMVRSALDAVPGLGPSKQKALLKRFGSLTRIKAASFEELCTVAGIGPKMARTILATFSPEQPAFAQTPVSFEASASGVSFEPSASGASSEALASDASSDPSASLENPASSTPDPASPLSAISAAPVDPERAK
ncbi:MAG: excinuclease ABC subunit UvrC [Arcanobacterium sp.]|nr:excinuclease ABC subunit UvrC [Arcanobacterium sp.]